MSKSSANNSSERKIPDGLECVGDVVAAIDLGDGPECIGKVGRAFAEPRAAEEIAARAKAIGGATKACLSQDPKFAQGYSEIFPNRKPFAGDPEAN